MATQEDVDHVRQIVQGFLVPIVFVIGLIGNSVSILVLTRKRMRCTTNLYLTALAITDVIYLTTVLLLSLQHYDTIHLNFELYWKIYGLVIWLSDGCAYISIYIAVCFTLERFIAIRYPLKRQTFCTEVLAKRIITGVALFCLLSTISTAFEYNAARIEKLVNSNGTWCSEGGNTPGESIFENQENIPGLQSNSASINELSQPSSRYRRADNRSSDFGEVENQCHFVIFYKTVPSDLRKNQSYTKCFFMLTSVAFVFIPMGILVAFNIFLIILVRKSKHRRGEMTNASVRRTTARKNMNISQENRVTVTLIAVVFFFIICQLPWAIYLLIADLVIVEINLKNIFGNIFNLLATINAASNFFLYCVLSDKYRKTAKELFVAYKYRRRNRSATFLPRCNQQAL